MEIKAAQNPQIRPVSTPSRGNGCEIHDTILILIIFTEQWSHKLQKSHPLHLKKYPMMQCFACAVR